MVKVSLGFTLIALLLAAGIGAALYEAGTVFGVVHGIDRVAVRVFNAKRFHLRLSEFVAGSAALAGVLGILATALLAIGALVYNLISEMTGGVRGRRSGLPPEGRRSARRAAETAAAVR